MPPVKNCCIQEMIKLRPEEVEQLFKSHSADKWQSQDYKAFLSAKCLFMTLYIFHPTILFLIFPFLLNIMSNGLCLVYRMCIPACTNVSKYSLIFQSILKLILILRHHQREMVEKETYLCHCSNWLWTSRSFEWRSVVRGMSSNQVSLVQRTSNFLEGVTLPRLYLICGARKLSQSPRDK